MVCRGVSTHERCGSCDSDAHPGPCVTEQDFIAPAMADSLRDIDSLTGLRSSVVPWHHEGKVGAHGAVFTLSHLVRERPEAFPAFALMYDTSTLALRRGILAYVSENDGAKAKRGALLKDCILSATTTPRISVVYLSKDELRSSL